MMLLPLGESSRCRKCEEMRMIVQWINDDIICVWGLRQRIAWITLKIHRTHFENGQDSSYDSSRPCSCCKCPISAFEILTTFLSRKNSLPLWSTKSHLLQKFQQLSSGSFQYASLHCPTTPKQPSPPSPAQTSTIASALCCLLLQDCYLRQRHRSQSSLQMAWKKDTLH